MDHQYLQHNNDLEGNLHIQQLILQICQVRMFQLGKVLQQQLCFQHLIYSNIL